MSGKIKTTLKWVYRGVVLLIVQLIAWVIIDGFVKDFSIENFGAAVKLILTLWVLNIFFWPFITKVTLKISVFTFGLFNLFLSGVFIWFASDLINGVSVGSIWAAIYASFVLSLINIVAGTFISIANTGTFYKESLKRRVTPKNVKNYPGIVFLEIDGLAHGVLKRALSSGLLPNIKSLIETSHNLEMWETDWSCQTGASQLGILHGNNHNIPAFRWYDKKTKTIVSSSDTNFTPLIEKQHSNGNGLLAKFGAARANMYSGDAQDTIFTSSTLKDFKKIYTQSYYGFFSDPYNVTRTLIFFFWEVLIEIKEQFRQSIFNVNPRLGFKKRFGVYPFVRGGTNVILKDVTIYALLNDIFLGSKDSIYLTFFGYDELAHHSGVEDTDTLNHLKKLDLEIYNIIKLSKEAKREYKFVILSDHGQSRGATFKQRYGESLEDLVKKGIGQEVIVTSNLSSMEDSSVLKNFTMQLAKVESISSKFFKNSLNKLLNKGSKKQDLPQESDVSVLASGNLALIYFHKYSKRLTADEVKKYFPKLLKTLVEHPGIGFVVVSTKNGGVVLGKKGKVYLRSKRIVGENPLKNYRSSALDHIIRSNSFKNAPDIFVNSTYYKKTKEVAAFEELIGSHGGMGGEQAFPFVIYPKDFNYPTKPIVGAEKLHKVLKSWVLGK